MSLMSIYQNRIPEIHKVHTHKSQIRSNQTYRHGPKINGVSSGIHGK